MASTILVRHGQPEHHVTDLTGGWTDDCLTKLGRLQASRVACRLKREIENIPYQVYCSDLCRALQTAGAIGEEIGAKPRPLAELREFNNGLAAGKSKQEARRYEAELTSPALDWRPYPQGETWREFYSRVSRCMDRLTETGEALILVTHWGTINNIIAWWLRLDLGSSFSFDASPGSLSVLRVNEWNERTLERLNDTSHLMADGLSEGMILRDCVQMPGL